MLDSIDVFWALLSRMGCSVATRAMYLSFIKTGCSVSLGLVLLFFALSKEGICCMEDAGPSTGGRAVDSGSGSGSWHKYLDLSEGNSESSKWSGSWIDRWLNQETASSAPRQPEGEVNQPIQPQPPGHQPTFDQPVQTQPPAAGPSEPSPAPPIPTLSQTKEQLGDFLSSFGSGRRRASSSFINRIAEELDLENASPQKLGEIIQIMENLAQRRGQSGLKSGQDAAAQLTMKIADWENR